MFGLLLPDWIRHAVFGAIALLVVLVGVWGYGEYQYSAGGEHVKGLLMAAATKKQEASVKVTTRVITEYIPKVEYIQGKVQTIVKEVPVYVTQKDDSACPIPASFVWLWNSANQLQLPGNPPTVPVGTSLVVLSDIEAQHTEEAGICLANEARIRATTEWLRQQKALYDGKEGL